MAMDKNKFRFPGWTGPQRPVVAASQAPRGGPTAQMSTLAPATVGPAPTSVSGRGLPSEQFNSDRPPPKRKNILQFEITKRKIPRQDLMNFSRQLAAFIRAGIPILEAIDTFTEETGNKTFRAALADIGAALRRGETFASAVAARGAEFPPFYVDMLRAAELTGRLDSVLDQLSRYIERD